MGNDPTPPRLSNAHLSPPDPDVPLLPPYVTPSGRALDVNHPSLSGWVQRQSEWVKEWRSRWISLKGGYLFVAKEEGGMPHDFVDLTRALGVSLEGADGWKVVLPDKTYRFKSADGRGWKAAVEKAIKGSLSKRQFEDEGRGMLLKGGLFEKHHHDVVGRFNLKHKDSTRIVRVTPDLQRITWHKPGALDVICDQIELHTVLSVNPGFTTLVFKQTGPRGKEDCCFSVVGSERSLDLECKNAETARKWVEAFRALLKYAPILSAAELGRKDEEERRRGEEEERRREVASRKHEGDRSKLRKARERAERQRQMGA
mmetsp:Transcript_9069/g.18145  ORF Transcript_9069/g.18145 Transcript_9069/m.18145 type:complete len:314 (+) Transcript_9069:206-1147(+)